MHKPAMQIPYPPGAEDILQARTETKEKRQAVTRQLLYKKRRIWSGLTHIYLDAKLPKLEILQNKPGRNKKRTCVSVQQKKERINQRLILKKDLQNRKV